MIYTCRRSGVSSTVSEEALSPKDIKRKPSIAISAGLLSVGSKTTAGGLNKNRLSILLVFNAEIVSIIKTKLRGTHF